MFSQHYISVFSHPCLGESQHRQLLPWRQGGLHVQRRHSTMQLSRIKRHRKSAAMANSADVNIPARKFQGSLGLLGEVLRIGAARFLTLGEESVRLTTSLVLGNYGPVDESIVPKDLTIIEGAIPADFPTGLYIRNGPNPALPALSRRHPLFGDSHHHWFEGDGMLHATAFRGSGKKATYVCRYVETEGLKIDRAANESAFRPTLDAAPFAFLANTLINSLLHGSLFKNSANTSVVYHNNRVLCTYEAGFPTEVRVPGLDTAGPFFFDGALDFNFSAHPKIDPETGEMVIFGYRASEKPYFTVGVVSKEGKLVHKVGISEFDVPCIVHDFAITERYTIIPQLGLTIRPERFQKVVDFESDRHIRFGIMPRFGDEASLKWFDAGPGYVFHFVNAYEDGDWVVVFGCRMARGIVTKDVNMSEEKYWVYLKVAPHGVAMEQLHEWRLNISTGEVRQRSLVPANHKADYPQMNNAWTGRKNKFGYTALQSEPEGPQAPRTMGFCKNHLPQSWEGTQVPMKIEYHMLGPRRFGNEAVFVARAGGTEEDDGWIVSYVHDEGTGESEVYIVDAKDFEGPPVARLRTSQRIPYGLHGIFIPMDL